MRHQVQMMGGFNLRQFCLVASVVSWSVALPARAVEMRPIVENMTETRLSYQLTRCAGLYNALAARLGPEQLDRNKLRGIDEAVVTFARLAAVALLQEGVTVDAKQASDLALRDVKNVMSLYVQRFHENYARTGEAFSTDELIMADLTLCSSFLGESPK